MKIILAIMLCSCSGVSVIPAVKKSDIGWINADINVRYGHKARGKLVKKKSEYYFPEIETTDKGKL